MRDHLDEAEAYYHRVVDIYHAIYGDHHYYVAVALSNIGAVNMDRKDYPRAEAIFRDVVRRFTEALGPDNVNTGTARLKLGRTLLREGRIKDAEPETIVGYQILVKQTSQSTSFMHSARKDLTAEYEVLHRPTEAARYRVELAQMDAGQPGK